MTHKDAGQAGSGEHTPTPWVYSPHRTTHDCVIHTENAKPNAQGYIDEGGVVGSSEWICLKPEDAEFIVLACNSHASLSAEKEALVKAVGTARNLLRRAHQSDDTRKQLGEWWSDDVGVWLNCDALKLAGKV